MVFFSKCIQSELTTAAFLLWVVHGVTAGVLSDRGDIQHAPPLLWNLPVEISPHRPLFPVLTGKIHCWCYNISYHVVTTNQYLKTQHTSVSLNQVAGWRGVSVINSILHSFTTVSCTDLSVQGHDMREGFVYHRYTQTNAQPHGKVLKPRHQTQTLLAVREFT